MPSVIHLVSNNLVRRYYFTIFKNIRSGSRWRYNWGQICNLIHFTVIVSLSWFFYNWSSSRSSSDEKWLLSEDFSLWRSPIIFVRNLWLEVISSFYSQSRIRAHLELIEIFLSGLNQGALYFKCTWYVLILRHIFVWNRELRLYTHSFWRSQSLGRLLSIIAQPPLHFFETHTFEIIRGRFWFVDFSLLAANRGKLKLLASLLRFCRVNWKLTFMVLPHEFFLNFIFS